MSEIMSTTQWILDVLEHLNHAAVSNEMSDLAQALDDALRIAHLELEAEFHFAEVRSRQFVCEMKLPTQ